MKKFLFKIMTFFVLVCGFESQGMAMSTGVFDLNKATEEDIFNRLKTVCCTLSSMSWINPFTLFQDLNDEQQSLKEQNALLKDVCDLRNYYGYGRVFSKHVLVKLYDENRISVDGIVRLKAMMAELKVKFKSTWHAKLFSYFEHECLQALNYLMIREIGNAICHYAGTALKNRYVQAFGIAGLAYFGSTYVLGA